MRVKSFHLVLILILITLHALGQKEITGKVTHAQTSEPLPGVNIVIKNTTSGTTTDENGSYKIILPAGADQLIFSYMGMITREIAVQEQRIIDVSLQPDLLQMEGIVVTAIGILREKKALGYSVQELPGKELTLVQHDNFINSLTGRVAGVRVTSSSGSAGASSYITIRGATSIDGNNQPLFILDGIPVANTAGYQVYSGVDMSNRAMDLNPDDIESVSILKGGAATALYGIRAANGAIVVTSRKGMDFPGRNLSTTFHTSLTIDKVSRVPLTQDRYGQGIYGTWISGAPVSWGPRLDTCSYSLAESDWQFPEYDADGAVVGIHNPNATGEPVHTYDPYEFLQTALSQRYALEIAGGGEKARFITSTSYNNSEGIVPGNNWKRFTLKLAGNACLSDKFNVTGSATYIHSGGDRIQKGSNQSGAMLGMLRTPATFNNAAGYELPDGSQRNYRHGSGYDNPYWTVNKNKFTDDVDRIIGMAGFDWLFTNWLKMNYRLGIDYFSENWKNYFAIGSGQYSNGFVWIRKYDQRDINSDLLLNASGKITDNWSAGFTLGHNLFETFSNELSSQANGLEIPDFYNLNNTSDLSSGEYTSRVRRAAVFGILEVAWQRMFFLTVTGRNEWSTTLPEGNNSFFYPSANISWVFTELKPFLNSKVLPFGKLRLSYARVANDAQPYRTTTNFSSYTITSSYSQIGLVFPLLGNSGFTLSNTLGNEDLKPENTTSWEIGTDLRWINNRIALDFTYFRQLSEDLLLSVPMSSTTGYKYKYMNAGKMSSRGIEAVLAVTPLKTRVWQWDAIFNYTLIKNRVEELAPGVNAVALAILGVVMTAYEGYPYQSFFGYDWLYDEDGNVIIDDNPESPSYGFPMANYDTLVYKGNYNPDWILGWTNIIKWKNLSLSFLIDIKKGGKMYNGTRGTLYYFGNHADQESREPEDQVIFEGVKQSDGSPNDILVVKGMNWYLLGEGSVFTGPGGPYVEKTDWIRLREISLEYDFDDLFRPEGLIKSLSVYLSGRNLLLITKYSGIDPETSLFGSSNAQGFDNYNMPGTRGFTLGLKMNF
jgi:TonB-linked SusC/RagA family outer membrane protein